MRNFKVAQTALEMIVAGYPIETVMNITGLDPDELLDIINGAIEHVVEFVLQEIESEMLGEFDVCVN